MSTGIDTVPARPATGTLSLSRSEVERLPKPVECIAAVSDDEITIFDSTGTALQDVAAAIAVYHRALQGDEGMALRLLGHVDLPEHRSSGGFDHADVHSPTDRLYVARTGNDAIDVIDTAADRYVESVPGFKAVAGALVTLPGFRKRSRFRWQGRMAWISTRLPAACCAPAMPACCSRSTRLRVGYSVIVPSAAPRT